MAKKKYSYNDRVKYHENRCKAFVERFRRKTEHGVTIDFHAFDRELEKQPKLQYSEGYSTFTGDITRGYIKPESELKQETKAFQRGFKAAKAAYEKSKNIKF